MKQGVKVRWAVRLLSGHRCSCSCPAPSLSTSSDVHVSTRACSNCSCKPAALHANVGAIEVAEQLVVHRVGLLDKLPHIGSEVFALMLQAVEVARVDLRRRKRPQVRQRRELIVACRQAFEKEHVVYNPIVRTVQHPDCLGCHPPMLFFFLFSSFLLFSSFSFFSWHVFRKLLAAADCCSRPSSALSISWHDRNVSRMSVALATISLSVGSFCCVSVSALVLDVTGCSLHPECHVWWNIEMDLSRGCLTVANIWRTMGARALSSRWTYTCRTLMCLVAPACTGDVLGCRTALPPVFGMWIKTRREPFGPVQQS